MIARLNACLRGQARALGKCRRGSIIVEFAAAAPMLALLVLGIFEIIRFAIAIQKVDRIAAAMGDYASQAQSVTENDLNNLFAAVRHIASPFSFDGGVTIISSVFKPTAEAPATIVWQRQGGGLLVTSSEVGMQGNTATLPAGMTLAANEGMIVSEAMMDFSPVFLESLIAPIRIYRQAFYRPRLSQQVALNPS